MAQALPVGSLWDEDKLCYTLKEQLNPVIACVFYIGTWHYVIDWDSSFFIIAQQSYIFCEVFVFTRRTFG